MQTTIEEESENRWLPADVESVTAPFDGVLVSVLENPVVYPGNPLCHFVTVEDQVKRILAD